MKLEIITLWLITLVDIGCFIAACVMDIPTAAASGMMWLVAFKLVLLVSMLKKCDETST